MLRATIAFVIEVLVTLTLVIVGQFGARYGEAEPLHPVAQEFAQSLASRLARENRRNLQWSDLTSSLAEERFARLRGRGFVPSSQPEVLVTIRINDEYEFPIHTNGTAGWRRPNSASSEATLPNR
ncbi:MAG TPA: hypothetical protein VF614_15065 [Chthoniobacteraceae bacterium]|jgi:hypothetical protein